jgi:hypothetical protein
MQADTAAIAPRSGRPESRVTTGNKLLDGVDGRTVGARRFRDLTRAFADELGGDATLTETERATVRQAAALTVHAERIQTAIVKGEAVDEDALVRVSSEARRLLTSLRRRSVAKKPAGPTLAQYLAGRAA